MTNDPKPPAKWSVVRGLLAAIAVGIVLWAVVFALMLGWVYFVRGHFD